MEIQITQEQIDRAIREGVSERLSELEIDHWDDGGYLKHLSIEEYAEECIKGRIKDAVDKCLKDRIDDIAKGIVDEFLQGPVEKNDGWGRREWGIRHRNARL